MDQQQDDFEVASTVLKEGPRSRKTARIMTIKNAHTGEVHHHALTIETGKKRQGSWELDEKHTVSLSDEEPDEIGKLLAFLQAQRGGAGLDAALAGDRDALRALARAAKADPDTAAAAGAAIAYGRHAAQLDRLRAAIDAGDDAAAEAAVLGQAWLVGDGALHAGPLDPGPSGLGELLVRVMLEAEGCARLIVGRDGDAARQDALRRLNAHLARLEVETWDAVLRRGKRVLDRLAAEVSGATRPGPG